MEYQKLLIGKHPYFVSLVRTSFAVHCHNEMEILFCVKGNFSLVIDKTRYDLQSNCAIFVNTIEKHELIIENSETEILVIEFGVSLLGAGFHEISKCKLLKPLVRLDSPGELPPFVTKRVRDIFKSLRREYASQSDGSDWMIRAGIFELSSIILRYFPVDKRTNLERQKRISNYLKIQKVFELVENEYQRPLTIKDAAGLVEYETKSFCRIFRQTTNMTFHKYLNHYRIDIATKLLEYNRYSIGEIAQYVGIPVPKTFSRVFREVTGMSPTKYRKIM